MTHLNYGVLVWYTKTDFQIHRQTYSFGKIAPLVSEINQIPPFQLSIAPATAGAITSFKLVNFTTSVETEILTEMTAGGLALSSKTNYDLIKYPAKAKFSGAVFVQGAYYAVMTDGVTTWYSEVFQMLEYIGRHMKIEYCHGESVSYEDGEIEYTGGYKNYIYLASQVGKPEYAYETTDTKRKARSFIQQMTRVKRHRFAATLPEYAIDTLSLIPLHDEVTITDRNGKVYSASDFDMENPEWQETARIANVRFSFTTEIAYVTVNARGVAATSCAVLAGSCFSPIAATAVAWIALGSPEHTGFYYVNNLGVNTNFVNGDLVLVKNSSTNWSLKQYQSSAYLVEPSSVNDFIYATDEDEYFHHFTAGILPNAFTSQVGNKVFGTAMPGTVVEVYTKSGAGITSFAGSGGASDYNDPAIGVTFDASGSISEVMVKVISLTCGVIFESEWLSLIVPCPIVIVGEYDGIQEAIDAGVQADEYITLSVGNLMGLPPIVLQINPTLTYIDDATALAAIGNDTCYAVSSSNMYGLPVGTIRVLVDTTTTYDNDVAAGLGGVPNNSLYVWSDAESVGFLSHLVKKLISGGSPT